MKTASERRRNSAARKRKQLHNVSRQFHHVTLGVGANGDAFDKPAQDFGRLGASLGIVKRGMQVSNGCPIHLG